MKIKIRILIASGADAKSPSKTGFTPLLFASQKGDRQTVASLLKAGADPNYTLANGTTVLQMRPSPPAEWKRLRN